MTKNTTKKSQDNKGKMASSNQVLIEHFDSKFDLLLDGYAMTNKKIDELISGLRDETNERFNGIDEHLTTIDNKFEAVFEVLDDIKKELKSVKI